jgi:hypothetical protein
MKATLKAVRTWVTKRDRVSGEILGAAAMVRVLTHGSPTGEQAVDHIPIVEHHEVTVGEALELPLPTGALVAPADVVVGRDEVRAHIERVLGPGHHVDVLDAPPPEDPTADAPPKLRVHVFAKRPRVDAKGAPVIIRDGVREVTRELEFHTNAAAMLAKYDALKPGDVVDLDALSGTARRDHACPKCGCDLTEHIGALVETAAKELAIAREHGEG